MSFEWLDVAKHLQSIAQAGLTYSKGKFDLERYEELRELSIRIVTEMTELPQEKVRDLFASETGYQTPKVEVRAVIFRNGKLLMVREATDGKWAMPGGWADVGLSPKEVVVKEVREEAGVRVTPIRLLGIMDEKNHISWPLPYHTYKVFILCRLENEAFQTGLETLEVGFFGRDELPELSVLRNTEGQVLEMFEFLENESKDAILE